jgi:hypothetical protein
MNIRKYAGRWRRPAVIAALAALGVLAAVPVSRAAAAADGCALGSYKDFVAGCTFDSDGDGVEDWFVADTDGDGILDTISYDSDNNFRVDTFYILAGGPKGKIDMLYDHDEDGLYDDEENFYGTDPYNQDTDWDGYSDTVEVQQGSQPLDPWCNPLGCG